MALQIDYIPSPTFEKIQNDSNEVIFVMGPTASGKSTGCVMLPFQKAINQTPDENGVRRWRHLVIRKTMPSLKLTTIKTWQKWFKGALSIKWTSPIIGKIEFPLFDGTKLDFEIIFAGAETDADVEKYRSLEVSSIHINEANELSRYAFEVLKTRFKRYPSLDEGGVKDPFIILDYNGVSTEHWLYELAEIERPEGYSFYRQPPAYIKHTDADGKHSYELNPNAENMLYMKDYYLSQMNSSEDFIAVNLMNDYGEIRRGKPVYKDYADSLHLIEPEKASSEIFKPISSSTVIIGMDLGLTPAAAFTQRLWDGTVVVFDEIVTEDCSIEEFVQDYLFPAIAKHRCGSTYSIILDPAAKQRSSFDKKNMIEMLKELGLAQVSPARAQDPIRRINAVTNYLRKSGKFKLYSNCKVLRRGFISEYKYAESNLVSGVAKAAKPEKNLYSHVHDALQYAMLEYDPGHSSSFRSSWNSFPTRKYVVPSSIGGY